jgi:hypothetical protein
MAIDKALYAAPVGVAALPAQPDIEIEIEDPKAVTINADGLEVRIEPEKEANEDFNANLAETMDERVLQMLASELQREITNDLSARKDWEKMYTQGIELMGFKIEDRTEPWPGACGVFHPMIAEAVVRFQSETIMETFPAAGPTKTQIIGKQTKEKEEAANRVKDDMNYQLVEKMPEFRPEHERMLFSLPGAGSAFKKVYYDPAKERQVSLFVPAEDVLLPYGYSDMHTVERITHRMRKTRNEVEVLQESGFWRDVDLPDPPKPAVSDIQKRKDKETGLDASYDNRYVIYEAHALLKIDGVDEDEPLALPYIVTMVEGLNIVLGVRRNWHESDPLKQKRNHFVHYQYIPGFGAYGFGLFHLIGGYAKNATSIMRQLVDAGTLSNLPGGLKSRGLRIKGDDTPIAPGEFRDVDIGSGAIRDNILPLPYKEPSQVLAQLLDKIIDEGRRFGSVADLKISDMSNQAPVGSTLAILERTLKVMSAVQARVHYAFKQELQLIAGIIKDYTPDDYDYDVEADLGRRAKRGDYDHVEIIPVSDPNAATMSQRVVQYQAAVQLSATAPQIYDLPLLHRQMLEVLGVKNAAKLVPSQEDLKPVDPVQENQNALKGRPLKAFAYQNHEAHIAVHRAAMQDPVIQQIVGQNPQAQMIMQAMMAHISEHVGYAYRNRMAQAMGIEIPTLEENEGYSPDVELMLSQRMAQAAPQVLAQSQVMVAQQQAQQNAQDPLIQIEMQDLAIKKAEVDRKAKKDMMDAAARADEIRLKEEKLELESVKLGANISRDTAQSRNADEKEGFRLGMDMARLKQEKE